MGFLQMGYSTVLSFAILVSLLTFSMPSSYADIKHTKINADEYNVKCVQAGFDAWKEMRQGAKERTLLC